VRTRKVAALAGEVEQASRRSARKTVTGAVRYGRLEILAARTI